MDKIEKWYKAHKASMDALEPTQDLWEDLESHLGANNSPSRPAIPLFIKTLGWFAAAASLAGLMLWLPGGGKKDLPSSLPDISLMSTTGETVSLSSLKGQVVLLEFWASWCNECQDKNCTELLPIYDQYKNKGFEIYAVSMDSIRDEWLLAIERDQLPWIQVSDLKGFVSPVSQYFGIDQSHTTFLLDQDHQIIGKDLSREELIEKLESCYQPN